ncbi:unnamed protein product, partial [Mesorhabditis spiculigera]
MNEEPRHSQAAPHVRPRPKSRLIEHHAIDEQDGTDKFTSDCYQFFIEKLGRLSEKEANDAILGLEKSEYERIHYGLIYALLTEPQHGPKYMNTLRAVATSRRTDPWQMTYWALTLVTDECFHKMLPHIRPQFVYIFQECIKIDVTGLDHAMAAFLRAINDVSKTEERIHLADQFFSMLLANKPYLQELKPTSSRGYNHFLAYVAHTCARMVSEILPVTSAAEHQPIANHRQIVGELLSWLVASRVAEIAILGRDFLLLLLRGTKNKEVLRIAEEIINKGHAGGFDQMRSRPPCLAHNRLSSQLDKKMNFMFRLRGDKMDFHWKLLENDYLRHQADPGVLRGEMIRYLLHHQQMEHNETFFFMEPKISILQHLLLHVEPNTPEMQWMKTCLWWDWMCFTPPPQPGKLPTLVLNGLLLPWNFVRHCFGTSSSPVISIGNSCLEFLFKSATELTPGTPQRIESAVFSALAAVRDTQGSSVISSVLDSVRVDRSYREQLRAFFKDFVSTPSVTPPNTSVAPPVTREPKEHSLSPAQSPSSASGASKVTDQEEEEVKPLEKKSRRSPVPAAAKALTAERKVTERNVCEIDLVAAKKEAKERLAEVLNLLVEEIRQPVIQLRDLFDDPAVTDSRRSEEVQDLIMTILTTDSVANEQDQLEVMAQALHWIFHPLVSWSDSILPANPTQENLEECFNAPIYVFFRNVTQGTHEDPNHRNIIIQLLGMLRDNSDALGFLLLFFLKFESSTKDATDVPEQMGVYNEVADVCGFSEDEILEDDMTQCALADGRLYSYLLPFVLSRMKDKITPKVLLAVCKLSNPDDVWMLSGEITRENLTLFKKETFPKIVVETLTWEVYAQCTFWKLVHAQDVSIDWCTQLFSKINGVEHPEAAFNVLLIAKRIEREPTLSAIRSFYLRPCDTPDDFGVNLLKALINNEDISLKVADLTKTIFKKQQEANDFLMATSKDKTQKGQKLSMEQVLFHLQQLSHHCLYKENRSVEKFLSQTVMREAFDIVTSSKDREVIKLREKYSDLLAAVVALRKENEAPQRATRQPRKANTSNKRPATDNDDVPREKKTRAVIVLSDEDD